MIRNILEMFLTIVVSSLIKFINVSESISQKVEYFAALVEENSINYILNDSVYLVFNYEYLEKEKIKLFEDYNVVISKENESCFYLEIYIEELFFTKEIKEKFYIDKGEIYV